MANKQMKELAKLSKDEAISQAREVEGKIFEARMKKATGSLENTALLWQLRKKLARLKTLSVRAAEQVRK